MTLDLDKSIEVSASNFGFLGLSKVLVQVTHLLILAVITRNLGTELFGKMSVFLMVTQFLYCLTVSWTAIGYTRFSMINANKGNPISEVFWCRNLVVFTLVLLTGGMLIAGRSQLADYLDLPSPIILIVFLHLFSLLTTDYANQVAQVTTEFKRLSVLQLIEKGLILVLVWTVGKDLFTILWIYIGTCMLCRIYFLMSSGRYACWPFGFNLSLCKKFLRFSYPLLLTSFGGFVFGWVDIAIVKHFSSLNDVGIYSLAYSGLGAVESIVLLMPAVLTPIFVTLAAQHREDTTVRFIRRILPQISYLWGFVFMPAGLISIWLIPLAFGPAFMQSVNVFLVLLVCLNLSVMNALIVPIFVGYNMVSKMVIVNFTASILNLVLDMALVPHIGIMGAAMATTFSYCCVTISYSFLIKSRFESRFGASWLFFGIVCIQLAGLVLFKPWFICIAISLAACGIYVWGSRYLGVFSSDDKAIYNSLEMPLFLKKSLMRICDYPGFRGRSQKPTSF